MRLEDLVPRLDELIAIGNRALTSLEKISSSGDGWVHDHDYSEFKAASLSFLDRTFGEQGAYSTQFRKEVSSKYTDAMRRGLGVLQGARGELAGGWISTTRGLISAEVFADFLEMAEHLLDEHYKDPAAVMIGGTLEEHLRQLAVTNGVAVEQDKDGKMVPRKADAVNAELGKVAYEGLDQKNVTAWLNLRNDAAHGHYDKYNEEQVRNMLSGVREFMGRVRV